MSKLFLNRNLPPWWRKAYTPLLAFSWCVGLMVGIFTASGASDTLIPMMYGAAQCSVSISGLLTVTVLPFLLSAFALSVFEPLLLIISAWKAFSFAFCAYGVYLAFGSAGWLVQFLFLFSDCCTIPLLFFYWLRHFSGSPRRLLVGCSAIGLLIGMIDYQVISPFLVMLLSS